MANPTMQSFSQPRRQLLRLMQQISFGRIVGVRICGGEPQFSPRPRVVREVKFGGQNSPRHKPSLADYEVKAQVAQLFEQLDELQHGTIDVLEVQHGLPFRMSIEHLAA